MDTNDLFGALGADAGKGTERAETQLVQRCTKCGTPLEGTARAGTECMRCAWLGSATDRRWTSSPDDALALGSYVPRTQPFGHQLAALRGLQGSVRALLMEMGTGKTKVIIDDWAMRVETGEVRDLIVCAPKSVYRNWEGVRAGGSLGELGIHLPERLLERVLVATWRSGGGTTWKNWMRHVLKSDDPRRPRVFLVNAEALAVVPAAEQFAYDFLGGKRRAVLAVDESTLMRNYDAIRTAVLIRLGRAVSARHKRIATGLPTPRSPLDLYAQFEFLDWSILGVNTWLGFKARYAIQRSMSVRVANRDGSSRMQSRKVVVGYRNVAELRQRIAPHSFRVLKDECLDLPPKVYMPPRVVELTAEQRRVYDEVRAQATSQLDGGQWVTAPDVLPRLIRLQQVLCGFVVDEEGVERTVPSNRLEALVETLQECSGKAIVWAPYQRSLREIVARLRKEWGPHSVVEYWGETKTDARTVAITRFQEDPACRWFVGNQAMGIGITLTAASLMCYYANSPNLEHRMQSEDRAHRSGLRHVVSYQDFIAEDTLDGKWVQVLRDKLDMASVVVGDAYKRWLV